MKFFHRDLKVEENYKIKLHRSFSFETPKVNKKNQFEKREKLKKLLKIDNKEKYDQDAYLLDNISFKNGSLTYYRIDDALFYLLKPKLELDKNILAIMPHGHTDWGTHHYLGLFTDEKEKRKILLKEKDIALQAQELGISVLLPVTRGFSPLKLSGSCEFSGSVSSCHNQLIHSLLAGKTPLGERVDDIAMMLHWAERESLGGNGIMTIGHSGGGLLAGLIGALEENIYLSIVNCAFSTWLNTAGHLQFCICNTIPGLFEFGDLSDIYSLISPRRLLIINGDSDPLYPVDNIKMAHMKLKTMFTDEQLYFFIERGGNKIFPGHIWRVVKNVFKL